MSSIILNTAELRELNPEYRSTAKLDDVATSTEPTIPPQKHVKKQLSGAVAAKLNQIPTFNSLLSIAERGIAALRRHDLDLAIKLDDALNAAAPRAQQGQVHHLDGFALGNYIPVCVLGYKSEKVSVCMQNLFYIEPTRNATIERWSKHLARYRIPYQLLKLQPKPIRGVTSKEKPLWAIFITQRGV